MALVILVPLSIATAWTQTHIRLATADRHWNAIGNYRDCIRRAAILLTAVVSMLNCGALFEAVSNLLRGPSGSVQTLLVDALNVYITHVD